jgi:repressor LexA
VLTEKQQQIYDFIQHFRQTYGQFPSLRQIGNQFSVTVRAVQQHIDALKKKGVLTEHQPKTATYQLPNEFQYRIPLLGSIAAGSPLEAIERTDSYVELGPEYFGPNQHLFALEVHGDSMSGDGIREGDTAIIRRHAAHPDTETIVAVRIDADEFTLKRLALIDQMVELRPSNPTYQPWQVAMERVEIVGKMIGLVRKL